MMHKDDPKYWKVVAKIAEEERDQALDLLWRFNRNHWCYNPTPECECRWCTVRRFFEE